MKTYVYCTPTHREMLDLALRASLPSELDLVVEFGGQTCQTGVFMKPGWNQTMQGKVRLVLRAIEETWGDAFLHVDADVQFFGEVSHVLREELLRFDMVAQNDAPPGRSLIYCGGFFACRSTPEVYQFWSTVLDMMEEAPSLHDQEAMNTLAKTSSLRIGTLSPEQFWSPRFKWHPGDTLNPPPEMLVHHANWTIGIENKEKQLKVIREIRRRRQTMEFHGTGEGGCHVDCGRLTADSVVYSIGAPGDTNFVESLVSKHGVKAHAFASPTQISDGTNNPAANTGVQFHLWDGLESENTAQVQSCTSCSIMENNNETVTPPAKNLPNVLSQPGHGQIDVIRLDIEGDEHVLLYDMLESQIFPDQIVVDFHDAITGDRITRQTVKRLASADYYCICQRGSSFTFARL